MAGRIHDRSSRFAQRPRPLITWEPAQADLLNRICAGPLRSAEELRSVGAFTEPEEKSAASKSKSKSKK